MKPSKISENRDYDLDYEPVMPSDADNEDLLPPPGPSPQPSKRTFRVKPRCDMSNNIMFVWDEKSKSFHKKLIKVPKPMKPQ